MKICVCSDIHGNVNALKEMLAIVDADVVLFLGDGLREFSCVNCELKIYAVAGNCDLGASEEESRLIELSGKRIFMTHGHYYQVKMTKLELKNKAKSVLADVVLFGHSHCQFDMVDNGVLYLNPGSLGYDNEYSMIYISGGGNITFEHKQLER